MQHLRIGPTQLFSGFYFINKTQHHLPLKSCGYHTAKCSKRNSSWTRTDLGLSSPQHSARAASSPAGHIEEVKCLAQSIQTSLQRNPILFLLNLLQSVLAWLYWCSAFLFTRLRSSSVLLDHIISRERECFWSMSFYEHEALTRRAKSLDAL